VIRTRNPWVLRLWNTYAIGCAKKTAENVLKLRITDLNWTSVTIKTNIILHYAYIMQGDSSCFKI